MEEGNRRERNKKILPIFLIFGLVLFFIFVGNFSKKAQAATAPSIITYQGKLLISNKLATTTQNMFFVLYDAPSGGSILYTASGTNGAPLPVSITPNQGLFSVNLGDTGTNALAPAIFQNNGSVYLEVRIGSDTLTPRKQITAAPYAINSRYLDGVGVNTNSTTQYIPMSDTSGNFTFNSTTVSSTLTVRSAVGVSTVFNIMSSTGASLVRVLSNGNVGIGTSTPSEKLSVVGNISNIIDANTVISQIATTSVGSEDGANDITVSGRYAYVANYNLSPSLSIIDISNPSAPVLISTTSVTGRGDSVVVSGRYAYMASSHHNSTPDPGDSAVDVVDISNPYAPMQVSRVILGASSSSWPLGIAISGHYVYTANSDGNSISVIDVSNPLAPVQIATTSLEAGSSAIAISGRYAYVTNFDSSSISVVDISNPATPSQIATTSVPTNPRSVAISGRYAYVTSNGDGADPDGVLAVIDVSNPNVPKQVASTSMGVDMYPNDIYVSGRYAYVTNIGGDSISVVDVSNPLAPYKISTIPVGLSDVVSSSPSAIYVSGRYAYTANGGDNTMSVIDISGTEVSSLIAHSAEVGNLQSRNDIFAQGNIMAGTSLMVGAGGIMSQGALSVFASSTDAISSIFSIDSAQTPNIFKVFANGNVGIGTSTPPRTFSVVGDMMATGYLFDSTNSSGTAGMVLQTNATGYAWVDTSSLGFPTGPFVNLQSVSSGTQQTGHLNISGTGIFGTSVGIGTSTISSTLTIQGLDGINPFSIVSSTGSSLLSVLQNGNVGIGTSTPVEKLSVVGNISNITSAGTVISKIATVNLSVGSAPEQVVVSGKYAYTSNFASGDISVVDISNPFFPVQISTTSIDVGNNPTGIFVSGRYLYVTGNSTGNFTVIDVSNPTHPFIVTSTPMGVDKPIFVSGHYAYISINNSFFSVVDISNPSSPTLVSSVQFNVDSLFRSIYVSGNYAYAANWNGSAVNEVDVIDISDPKNPIQIATTTVDVQPNSIFVSGQYAYTANAAGTISIINITNPASPKQVANPTITSDPKSIFVSGRYAYVAGGGMNNISIVDISSSTAPYEVTTAAVSGGPKGIFVSGRYAYVVNNTSNNMSVVDISGTEVSSLIAHSAEVGNLQIRNDIFAQGNIMAGTSLTVGAGGIMSQGALSVFASSTVSSSIFDISSAQTPNILKVFANGNVGIGTSIPAEKLSVVGNISNIISAGTTISQISSAGTEDSPYSIFVSGRYAYTANYTSSTISVIDISNPSAPIQIATTSVGTSPVSIFVSGRYAYTANYTSNTISVVDISNPKAPIQVATTSVGIHPRTIYVSGRYAYVANSDSGNVSVVDISNPKAPIQITTAALGVNPYSIYISGRYAYTVSYNTSTPSIISVIDISNPSLPVQVATTSVNAGADSIFVSGRYAYTANYDSGTMSVVDISNPSLPVQIATTSVDPGPNSVFVSGRYAYLATDSDTLVVVDISNPLAPAQIISTSVGFSPNSVYVSGRYAYTANSGNADISVVDISGTEVSSLIAHSAEVGNLQSRNDIFAQGNIMAGTSLTVGVGGIMSQGPLSIFASSTGATSSVFDISSAQTPNIFKVFANGNVGIGTSTPSEKLQVVGNISNITKAGTVISQIATTSVGSQPQGIFVSGRYAYTANYNASSISIVDISNPSAPIQIATTSVGTNPYSIYVSGRYAYTANFTSNDISIIDISNPAAPIQTATSSVGTGAHSIYISGHYAYVANFTSNNISVVDISNSLAPVQISTTSVGTNPSSIYVSGRYAYVTNQTSNDLSVVDISNPAAPVQIATTSVGTGPFSIYVSGRYAYAANISSNNISVVDISKSSAPIQTSTLTISGGSAPTGIFVSGRYAYVTNQTTNMLAVINISNPSAPIQLVTTSVGTVPYSVFVSGRYAYITNRDSNTMSVVDISGTEVSSLIAHSAEVGNLQSRNDIFAQGNIMAGTSLVVGAGGIMSQGPLSIFAPSANTISTPGNATSSIFGIDSPAEINILKVFANGFIGINTATQDTTATLRVRGSIETDLTSPTDATSALCHVANGGTKSQVIYDCNGTVGADYMEMYAADAGLQLGDVVALSNTFVTTTQGHTIPKLSKAVSAYQSGLVGVISDVTQAGDFNSVGRNISDADNPLPLALNGRVLIKVSNANGDIHVGDKLTSSNIPGVAMKATEEGPAIAIAMGDYTSSEVGTVMGFVNISWNNKIYKALTVDTNSSTITVGTSVNPYDLVVTGNISLSNTSVVNKLSFATSTLFESSVASFSGARAFILNAPNFVSTSADNYIISLRANNNPVFSVAANGDVHARGNYFGASAVLGTSTNPGDLAERVDVAVDDTVEPGDVMIIDQNAPDTYRRSGSAYEQAVAGIISSNPTIVVGNGKTDYTAIMAMVGRVPVKVSNENGNIQRGDLLITASTTGLAMKYDSAKDNNNKMVAVIGVALESLNTSTGKVLTLIRTGWIYNRDQAINNLQNSVEQMAAAQGINLASTSAPGNLNVQNTNGQLTYVGGNLDLQNNSLINVATIVSKDNKWRIDESGNLIQKIATASGDKETYSLQSSGKQEIIISGTSTLENGSKKVMLQDLDQAIIDKTVPLKIQITMSGETKGVYVSERSYDSFTVKENDNGQDNASFDWTVIAKILPPDLTQATADSGQANNGSTPVADSGSVGPVDVVTTTPDSVLPTETSSSTSDTTTDISSSTTTTP